MARGGRKTFSLDSFVANHTFRAFNSYSRRRGVEYDIYGRTSNTSRFIDPSVLSEAHACMAHRGRQYLFVRLLFASIFLPVPVNRAHELSCQPEGLDCFFLALMRHALHRLICSDIHASRQGDEHFRVRHTRLPRELHLCLSLTFP